MLKNINPLLNADILFALAAMGHGDSIVLCDSNFPAHTVASSTILGKELRSESTTVTQLAEAVLSLMPLDTFIEDSAICMEVVDAPEERPEVQLEVQHVIDSAESVPFKLVPIERYAFYEKAKRTFAVISSGERRFYGCFILTKGVIAPPS